MMARPASPGLAHGAIPWLQGCTLLACLPHADQLPTWLNAISALLVFWSLYRWRRQQAALASGIRLLLAGGLSLGIALEFGQLLGRLPGVALLVAMACLKLHELNTRRDANVLLALNGFLLLCQLFTSQELPTGILLLAASLLLTTTLLRIHGPNHAPLATYLRPGHQLWRQSLPLALALFLFFPRIDGPLWGLPLDAHSRRSGLSEQISPGSVAELALSQEIAFRVRFIDPPPATRQLYWRGPVLEHFTGDTWQIRPASSQPPQVTTLGPRIRYQSTLEASQQNWLLALDAPTRYPAESYLDPRLSLRAARPIEQRQQYQAEASLDYRFNQEITPGERMRNLQLPPGNSNPRTRQLAQAWRQAAASPEQVVTTALNFLATQGFSYTLRPPPLGVAAIDDFLFSTRSGFCEHYASAFTFLMRAAGLPARVVVGYQGGEINPVDGYLSVRQADAHAWSEVWLAGRGWQRVDPTASIAPERIEMGSSSFFADESSFGLGRHWATPWMHGLRQSWEALNNAWNQQVLGFNLQRQRELFRQLQLSTLTGAQQLMVLGSLFATLIATLSYWILRHAQRSDPAQRLWQKALHHLAQRQVNCAPGDASLAILAHVERQAPELAPAFSRVVASYLDLRYGPTSDQKAQRKTLHQLRTSVTLLIQGH